MVLPLELCEQLRLPDPARLPADSTEVLLAYHRLHEGLRPTSDGGVVFDEYDAFGLSDWVDLDNAHTHARIVVTMALFRILQSAMEAKVSEDAESGWDNDSDEPDDWSPAKNLLERYRNFLKTQQGESLSVHAVLRDDIYNSIYWTITGIMISSSGCIRVVGFTDEWCAVFDQGEERGDGLGRLPMFLGFASRTCLHRSVGRVLTDTLGRYCSAPDELAGDGFDDFEVAFIGACMGREDDLALGEALLSVDEAQARAEFVRADGSPTSLIDWARRGCSQREEDE